jgi:hypothetical protein
MASPGAGAVSLFAATSIATLSSYVLFITAAIWYVAPWMRSRPLAVALSVPLLVHAYRFVALQLYSAQHFGLHISNALLNETAAGDLAGAALALVALWLLRRGSRAAVPVLWVFVVETIVDLVNLQVQGFREEGVDTVYGLTWLNLNLYVPLVWVTLGLIVWRLLARSRLSEVDRRS